MANVMLVSQIRLGDSSIVLNWMYRLVMEGSGHRVSEIGILDFDPDAPDLSSLIQETNPDTIFLSTATTVPHEQRAMMYSHLRGYGIPLLIADFIGILPGAPMLRTEANDTYLPFSGPFDIERTIQGIETNLETPTPPKTT